MFYSDYEIEFMSKSHGRELRRLCEKSKSNTRDAKSNSFLKLLQGLIVKALITTHKDES